jgi:hypothetical protein
MKQRQHRCSVDGCQNLCWLSRPFCVSCWCKVPSEERAAVGEALKLSTQPDADPDALRFAIAEAAASVRGARLLGPKALTWELLYWAAGAPEL